MTQHNFDNQTESQLKVLGEISAIFSSIEGCFWLRGGWAIDFLIGQITRSHEDLDLVTWVQHRDRLEDALVEAAFERTPISGRQTDFRKSDVDVQFLYLTQSGDGHITPNGLPEWVWRADALLPQCFILNGISAYVLHPRQLLEEKEVYEQIGRTPRVKDLASKEMLQKIIEASF